MTLDPRQIVTDIGKSDGFQPLQSTANDQNAGIRKIANTDLQKYCLTERPHCMIASGEQSNRVQSPIKPV